MKAFYEWESPWRPNIEAKMAASWALAATATLFIGKYMPVPLPSKFSVIAMSVCTAMAVYRGTQAWHRYVDQTRMGNYGMEFITISELMDKTALATKKSSVWLGTGFDWTDVEAQKMHAMLAQGVAQTIGKITNEHHLNGEYWIHGLDKETDRFMEVANLVGHTLLVGTTRVGKTRMMELLIGQAIMRGETVIIIDPKGDHALAENARKICAANGMSGAFRVFSSRSPGEIHAHRSDAQLESPN